MDHCSVNIRFNRTTSQHEKKHKNQNDHSFRGLIGESLGNFTLSWDIILIFITSVTSLELFKGSIRWFLVSIFISCLLLANFELILVRHFLVYLTFLVFDHAFHWVDFLLLQLNFLIMGNFGLSFASVFVSFLFSELGLLVKLDNTD